MGLSRQVGRRAVRAFAILALVPGMALAQSPIQGQMLPPGGPSGTPPSPGAILPSQIVGMPGTPSIKDMQSNKTEFLRAQLDAFKAGLKLQGRQVDAFGAFDKSVIASVPASVKFVRDFCADPTPREGRGSFGAAAKRLGVVVELLKGREVELTSLDKTLEDLRQSLSGDERQMQIYKAQVPNIVSLVTTVPFGLPDTGLPVTCSIIDGVPAGEAKGPPLQGMVAPNAPAPNR